MWVATCHHGTPLGNECEKCMSIKDCPNCTDLRRQFKRYLDAKEIEWEQRALDAYREGLIRGLEHAGGDTYQADVPMEKK